MFHIGIIGCGKIAQVRHIPEYADNPDAQLTAFYDLNAARAQELAERYGGKAYDSVEALLADPNVDAVSVCSANASHAQIAVAALEAGKHVLCEKPMATTLADCERMVSAAKKSGKKLMIDQNQRLAGAHVKARELIEQGEIGSVITFATAFRHGGPETWSVDPGQSTWFFDKKRAAMGAMADLGVHKTDLIQYLIGQTVDEVEAQLCTLDKKVSDGSPITVDDNAFCIYHMDGGAVGTMTASWTNYGPEDNSTVINGTKGVLRIYDDPEHTLILEKKDGSRVCYDVDAIHFDDYFYATTDSSIDSVLYAANGGGKSLAAWRRQNVNTMVREVYAAVKAEKQSVRFGISPQGNTKANYDTLYADVATWLGNAGYVDYICPQIYYGFNNATCPYSSVLTEFNGMIKVSGIDLYVGLAAYKIGNEDTYAGTSGKYEWQQNSDLLSRMVTEARGIGHYKGYCLYSYSSVITPASGVKAQVQAELTALSKIL